MSFSDSNRVGLRFIEESTWGTTPATPTMQALNFSSESFKSNNNTVTSDTIRDDRNVADIVVVGGGAAGDFGMELRYGDLDALLAGALQSTWTTTNVSGPGTGTFSAYFSGAKVNAGSSLLAACVSGQFVRVANASATANNGDYRITAVASMGSGRHNITLADASTGSAANAYVRRTIKVSGPAETRGGIKGCFPVNGGYGIYQYLNWA